MSCDLFIFAGEHSGDIQGDLLLKALLATRSGLKIEGVLGPRMRKHCATNLLSMEEFQVMGFTDVIKSLKKLRKHFLFLKRHILKTNPKAVLLIDYPGFNLKLAKSLKKSGYKGKIIHHVCPTIWAWKKGRIKTIEESIDLLLCLFPFEPAYFTKKSPKALFVGHSLANKVLSFEDKKPLFDKPIISIFPGSREKEIFKNFPLQLKACSNYLKANETLVISEIDPKYRQFFEQEIIKYPNLNAQIVSSEYNYSIMRASKLSIATSGTITLELALHRVPTVVTYFIKPIDFFLARKIFRIDLPHYCIVNLLAKRRLFPECYGPHFCENMVFNAFEKLYNNKKQQDQLKIDLAQISKLLYNEEIESTCSTAVLEQIYS